MCIYICIYMYIYIHTQVNPQDVGPERSIFGACEHTTTRFPRCATIPFRLTRYINIYINVYVYIYMCIYICIYMYIYIYTHTHRLTRRTFIFSVHVNTQQPDSLDARLFPSVVLAAAPAVTMDEASSLP